jgi:GT2 family glycosyltransferase
MLYLAITVGIIFVSFWVAQIVFVRRHLKWTESLIETQDMDKEVGVSIIHPIKDLDFEFEKNLESWMHQNYSGPVQHIFSFQDPNDAAIKVVEEFIKRYPEIDMSITVNPVMPGLNGKSSNMVNGMKLAKYDMLLFGDSDVRVRPDFIVKMVRPLRDEKVGITTCGQINIGGRDFWTRFFTFLQNSETDFMWAFFTKIGMDVGATGAAFGMRKKLLQEIGGLEAFGNSLLEDLHLGNTLYRMGYKLELGPFVECHVDKLAKEKSLNYAKRIAVGIKAHIAFELPTFLILLFWYWALLIVALIMRDKKLLYLYYKKKINCARVFVMFVIPAFRKKGVSHAIYYQTFINAVNKGYRYGEASTIGETNYSMRKDIESIGAKHYKTYRIYSMKI